jgi:DNA-binding NarL/FixJ family response regulator
MRAVVADDDYLLREGLVRLLTEQGVDVVAQAADADDLLRRVAGHRPDVAIVDIRMPPTHTDDGLRAAIAIRETYPATGVLLLSHYVETQTALRLLSRDAAGVGYLLKSRVSDVRAFADAVRRVADGGSALDPEIVQRLLGAGRRHHAVDDLTPREREVLALMAEGRSNLGIAQRLVITERAVQKHVSNIFAKLDLPAEPEDHRRVLAVLMQLTAARAD